MSRDHHHLTRALLRPFFRGHAGSRLLMELAVRQLAGFCPECRRELETFFAEEEWRFGSRQGQAEGGGGSASGETAAAGPDELLDTLRALSPAARLELVRADASLLATPEAVAALLEEGLSRLPAAPEEAHAWAEAAHLALATGRVDDPALHLRAASHRANARRAMGDLLAAEEGFFEVRRLRRELGVADPAVLAEIAKQEASLHMDFRDFARAEGLLTEALAHYRSTGEPAEEGRVLMQLSALHLYAGDPQSALEHARQAACRVVSLGDPRLKAYAAVNYALMRFEAGDPFGAQELLMNDEAELSDNLDPLSQLRRTWLEGRIELAMGSPEVAEAALLAAREGFLDRQQGFNLALVSLDLALLYLKENRYEDLERVTTEAVTLFQANAVHRDALAALILLRDAVAAREAEAATIEHVARCLRQAQLEPRARRPRPT